MNDHWFFSWGLHQFGPFSQDELKGLAASGRLQPTDLVWRDGMAAAHGVIATRVKNLFHASVTPGSTDLPGVHGGPAQALLDAAAAAEVAVAPSDASDEAEAENQAVCLANAPGPEAEEAAPSDPAQPPGLPEELVPGMDPQAGPADTMAGAARDKKPPPPPKKKQVTAKAVSGVIVVSQDGARVNFLKKCPKCGHEDSSRQSLPIRNGSMRMSFFCPTCRKSQAAEIQGSVK